MRILEQAKVPYERAEQVAFIRAYANMLMVLAKEGFERSGRGVVLVEQVENQIRIMYLQRRQLQQIIDPATAEHLYERVAAYNPTSDFVCVMVTHGGMAHAYCGQLHQPQAESDELQRPPTA
jgi:hypothetical protein